MKILFVCSGNACRSPFAEALLKKLRPDLEVDSAGLYVVVPISEHAKEYLAKRGAAQYIKEKPQSVSEKKLEDYSLIVAMEKRHKNAILDICPECKSKIEVWNVEDPYFLSHEEAEKIYKLIESKVKEIAKSL
jgi:protein-tyrosine phosphatase